MSARAWQQMRRPRMIPGEATQEEAFPSPSRPLSRADCLYVAATCSHGERGRRSRLSAALKRRQQTPRVATESSSPGTQADHSTWGDKEALSTRQSRVSICSLIAAGIARYDAESLLETRVMRAVAVDKEGVRGEARRWGYLKSSYSPPLSDINGVVFAGGRSAGGFAIAGDVTDCCCYRRCCRPSRIRSFAPSPFSLRRSNTVNRERPQIANPTGMSLLWLRHPPGLGGTSFPYLTSVTTTSSRQSTDILNGLLILI